MEKFFEKTLTIVLTLILVISSSCKPDQEQKNLQIHDLQGCDHISPFNGKEVTEIVGVVTHKVSNGFTMQSIDPDEKQCSSEAIFVFTNDFPDVMTGDLVKVDGIVSEFTAGNEEDSNLSITEIIHPRIANIESNFDLPNPILMDDPRKFIPRQTIEDDGMTDFDVENDGLDYFESLESMLVETRSGTVVAPRNEYNEIVILPDEYKNSNILSEEGALLTTEKDKNPEKIMIKLPSSFDQKVGVGEKLATSLTGILDYSHGNYKLLSLHFPEFSSEEISENKIDGNKGGLSIVSYNLENLSQFDEGARFDQFANQIIKKLKSPDILVLHEVMDNSGSVDDGTVNADKTVKRLIEKIMKEGGPEYRYSDAPPENNQDGGLEGGNIRSVLLYRIDRGIQLENPIELSDDWFYNDGKFFLAENPLRMAEYHEDYSGTRKPVIWLLQQNGTQFFVIGVHLISQSSNSPEWGSQQPPIRTLDQKRIKQAKILYGELNKILEKDPQTLLLVAGDMNDLPWSDTISELRGNWFINTGFYEEANEQFSYIFEGNAQQLDYILINKNLADNVLQARFLHLNTILDREDQMSDHDPFYLLVILNP